MQSAPPTAEDDAGKPVDDDAPPSQPRPATSSAAVDVAEPDDEAVDASPKLTIEALFSVALSHGRRIATRHLDYWAYRRFFEDLGIKDDHMASTGVPSLMLEIMWARHCVRDEQDSQRVRRLNSGSGDTSRQHMTLVEFEAVFNEMSRRCYVASKVEQTQQQQQQPVVQSQTITAAALETAGDRRPPLDGAESVMLSASVLQPQLDAENRAVQRKAVAYTMEFIARDFFRRVTVHEQTSFRAEDDGFWAPITRNISRYATAHGGPVAQRFINEFSTGSGALNLLQFTRMLAAMGEFGKLVDEDLIAPVFERCNSDDTAGLESGEIADELELDESINALQMLAFAVFGDEDAYPHHVSIHARLFEAWSMIVAAGRARYSLTDDDIYGTPEARAAQPHMAHVAFHEEPYIPGGLYDFRPPSGMLPHIADPLLGTVYPDRIDLDRLDTIFIGGAFLRTPVDDRFDPSDAFAVKSSMRKRAINWGELLGYRGAAPGVLAKMRQSLIDEGESIRDYSVLPPLTAPAPPPYAGFGNDPRDAASFGSQLDGTQQQHAGESKRRGARRASETLRMLGVGVSNDAPSLGDAAAVEPPPATTRQAIRDAQWLMSDTFDPRATELTLTEQKAASAVSVWIGDKVVRSACVCSNRLQALPVGSCANPDHDMTIVTSLFLKGRVEIGCTHGQTTSVRLSRGPSGVQSTSRLLLLLRSRFAFRPLPRADSELVRLAFASHSTPLEYQFTHADLEASTEALSEVERRRCSQAVEPCGSSRGERVRQRFITREAFHTILGLLRVPPSTMLPRFALPPKERDSRHHFHEREAWDKLFDAFAAQPGAEPAIGLGPKPGPAGGDLLQRLRLVRAAESRPRTVAIELNVVSVARIQFDGAVPRKAKEPLLAYDGFVLCILYGLAGSAAEHKAISAESLVLVLRSLLAPDKSSAWVPDCETRLKKMLDDEAKARAEEERRRNGSFDADEDQQPAIEPEAIVIPVVDAADGKKKKKKGGAKGQKKTKKEAGGGTSPGQKSGSKGRSGSAKGRKKGRGGSAKKRSSSRLGGPLDAVDYTPRPKLLERSKYAPVPPPPIPVIDDTPSMLLDRRVDEVNAQHPAPLHRRLQLYGPNAEQDVALLTPARDAAAAARGDDATLAKDRRFTPLRPAALTPRVGRRLHVGGTPSVTTPEDAEPAMYQSTPLMCNTTINAEPVSLTTPRRARLNSRGEPAVAVLTDEPPDVSGAVVSPSAVTKDGLRRVVSNTSRHLIAEHLTHSMVRVQSNTNPLRNR